MKKIIVTSLLVISTQVCAGTMGPISTGSQFVPFVSGEAAATWNSIKSNSVFGNTPSLSTQHWGGRGAVGIVNQYTPRWGYSAEIGWGYYGQTKSNFSGSTPDGRLTVVGNNSNQIYGFDVLAGLLYRANPCDLFVKAGAMVENRYFDAQITNRILTNGFPSTNTTSITNTQTNVYPEIKIGAIYNVNEHLGISVAYMGVFGNDSLKGQTSGTIANGSSATNFNSSVSLHNPNLNSVIFGLVYNFV